MVQVQITFSLVRFASPYTVKYEYKEVSRLFELIMDRTLPHLLLLFGCVEGRTPLRSTTPHKLQQAALSIRYKLLKYNLYK